MSVEVKHWSADEAPTETSIRRILAAENLAPYRWSNAPGDMYGTHAHPYHKVLYVVEGSITFGLPETGRQVLLQPGDRMELPPDVVHDAVVGPDGVICLEAHRR